ncbi:WD repeat-containing protein on Y chromosome-like isoform X2 [Periplaneta americana]|uniref:WD repeat-containing protein on Y chromosome-like isoform X2 n=1 Tax=Periplaneta americana TaxID=6978 RepID=UPI0037E90CE9
MNVDQLKAALQDVGHVVLDDDDFNVLFMKMDSKRDGYVDWDEFVSHIVLEFQVREAAAAQQSMSLPLEDYPKMTRSYHRHPVLRVTFFPAVLPDRSINYLSGKYLTASNDGIINYWSLDMEFERSVRSESLQLKVRPTWVTDLVCLPDVSIVCTSSTERELRFYDTTANHFELRIIITSLEYSVSSMYYHFNQDIKENSYLVLGDNGGNIRILYFNSKQKGPFYHTPGDDVIHILYEGLVKGELSHMNVIEFRNIHSEWVNQVSYYSSLNSFVSCAPCAENSLYLCDVLGTKNKYSFSVAKGVSCFNIAEDSHLIVTGSQDCLVRVWNAFVPKKAIVVFEGHHTAICSIVLQDSGQKIYSLSKDRCIKVWDVPAQECIQTYVRLPADLAGKTPLATFYNPLNRNLIIASKKIAVVICGKIVDEELTDGYTHTKAVTKALYNPLFKCIVTVGMDSHIIVWDPWTGNRLFLVKDAHTRILYGEVKPVEITAATFDTSNQLLLTGASDGTIKIWNFNTGTCIRHMNIEENCEVTSVTWLKNRILAVGWNMHITEFADTGKATHGKPWETRHTDDVLCAAVRVPQTIVTSSYSGELVFWMLETGQPYGRYNVSNPKEKLALSFKKSGVKKAKSSVLSVTTRRRGSGTSIGFKSPTAEEAEAPIPLSILPPQYEARRVSVIHVPTLDAASRPLSIHAMIFLQSRPMQKDVGTLLVAIENGNIQVWSHHTGGGYISSFFAIHTAGDYVAAMATDPDNEYLFTGTTVGYVKIWLMKNFMVPWPVKLVMPTYRIQFPFLWKDRVAGRAKRSLREQPLPLLLSSYKAHLRAVTNLEYIPSCKILVSCSSDTTVRLWSLGGRYLGTLGTELPWLNLRPDKEPVGLKFRFPPDIKRVMSSTTRKIPVYCHLKTYELEDIEIPPTPKYIVESQIVKGKLSKASKSLQAKTSNFSVSKQKGSPTSSGRNIPKTRMTLRNDGGSSPTETRSRYTRKSPATSIGRPSTLERKSKDNRK